ncbi:AMP-binding protein [Hoeflea alexandrii]|uniref:AMP-binding protein n=1 Tax=Hoeflea alexandrii TaxID=288436 RepID=UPI0022AF826E|nr:AMP-binding protein [Hoeflea alexandrii]MCZ4291675.1 AMP-binding protein [Hoeflea alexandrii]
MDLQLDNWTLGRALGVRAESDPDKTFIDFTNGPGLTYAAALDLAQRVAGGLDALGVAHGDQVITMLPNGRDAISAWLGLGHLGAVEVCLNTGYRGQPLAHALTICKARVMILAADYLPAVLAVDPDAAGIDRLIVVGDPDHATGTATVSWQSLVASPPLATPRHPVRGRDAASILFTSGTTGPAKPVILTHAQNHLTAAETARRFGMGVSDISYCFHPLFHMAGKFMAVYGTLIAGASIVLDHQFVPDQWSERLCEYKATLAYGHGPMIEMIHASPPVPKDKQNTVRRVLGAPFPVRIAEDFETRFGLEGMECWGMTEIGIVTWAEAGTPRGSCGKVSEFYDLCIVDPDTDEELPAGRTGEILVRPRLPWITFQGYYGMAEATVSAWRNLWFHTGDMGRLEPDGHLYFSDRVKDRIRRRSENISSFEIEAAALSHAAVAEAAAVGVASRFEGDDDVKLCLVVNPDTIIDPADLLRHLAGQLPHYMIPRYVDIRDSLPRSNTNKVRKAVLRAAGTTSPIWDREAAGLSVRALYEKDSPSC